jgi:hypothetical protein
MLDHECRRHRVLADPFHAWESRFVVRGFSASDYGSDDAAGEGVGRLPGNVV